MLFRAFVPNIVNCLEDADGEVRQKAQATVIRLFRYSRFLILTFEMLADHSLANLE